jgi:hypothetical protein
MICSADATVSSGAQKWMFLDITSETGSALGGASRKSVVIAMSLSVTTATARPSSSTTGTDRQSQSHMSRRAADEGSPVRKSLPASSSVLELS